MSEQSTTPASRERLELGPLLAVCTGYFMVILDVTIVNVAAPAIGREFDSSLTGVQWVVDGYTVAFAGLLLAAGALGDCLGHRRVFLLGVGVFTLASLGCLISWDIAVLTVFRLLEGTGSALLVPSSLALLQQAYPTPGLRARAFGLWGSIGGVAASVGPLLGGVLTSTVGWRWAFAINLPVGVVCVLLTLRWVVRSQPDRERAIDWPAQAAMVVSVAAFIGALNEVGRHGLGSPIVLVAFALTLVAAACFAQRERWSPTPPVPLSMLASRPFVAGTLIGFLFNFGFYGMIFAASVFFPQHDQLCAAMTGLALLPAVVVTMVAAAVSGRLSGRFGHRPLMLAGLAFATGGLALWAVAGEGPPYLVLAVAMAACGFGTSFSLTGATATVMSAALPGYEGTASAAFNTSRQTGSAAGVAVSGSLVAALGLSRRHPRVHGGGRGRLPARRAPHRPVRTGGQAIRRSRVTVRPASSTHSPFRRANSTRCGAARWVSRSSAESQFS